MRRFGYISKKEIIEIAVDTYRKNCKSDKIGEHHFGYSCGNANAIGYICGRLGIDITKEIKEYGPGAKEKTGESDQGTREI